MFRVVMWIGNAPLKMEGHLNYDVTPFKGKTFSHSDAINWNHAMPCLLVRKERYFKLNSLKNVIIWVL